MSNLHETYTRFASSETDTKIDLRIKSHLLHLARQELILPWGMNLSAFDPLAEIYILGTGQRAEQPSPFKNGELGYHYLSQIRPESDLDVLVISPRLLTPKHYIRFLEDLSTSGAHFKARFGIPPVFFSRSSSKHSWVALGKMQHGPHVIPIHFLFYPSRDAFFYREGQLAENMIHGASAVIKKDIPTTTALSSWALSHRATMSSSLGKLFEGKHPCINFPPRAANMLRWDLERSVADFVLNYPSNVSGNPFHVEFMKGEFSESIRKCFRDFSANRKFLDSDGTPIEPDFVSQRANAPGFIPESYRPDIRGAPPRYFGHSSKSQRAIVDLACRTVGSILLGDFSPDRALILEYGQALLEACFIGEHHKSAFKRALRGSYSDLTGSDPGQAVLSTENRAAYWQLADNLAASGELCELTHAPPRDCDPHREAMRRRHELNNLPQDARDRLVSVEFWAHSELSNLAPRALRVPADVPTPTKQCAPFVEELFRSVYHAPPDSREEKVRQISALLTEDDIRQGLSSAHPDVRARAIECWGNVSLAPELLDQILDIAQTSDARVTAWAIRSLARRYPADKRVEQLVSSHLSQVELFVGVAAIEAAKSLSGCCPSLLSAIARAETPESRPRRDYERLLMDLRRNLGTPGSINHPFIPVAGLHREMRSPVRGS